MEIVTQFLDEGLRWTVTGLTIALLATWYTLHRMTKWIETLQVLCSVQHKMLQRINAEKDSLAKRVRSLEEKT